MSRSFRRRSSSIHARQALGSAGEERAARWYREQGYEVIARNWRCELGELDLVARRDREYVFCEVKTRSSTAWGYAEEAVTAAKRARLRRLAGRWLAEGGASRDRGR